MYSWFWAMSRNNWKARTSPRFFCHFWKCSKIAEFWHDRELCFTWETLLWSFLHWLALCFRETMYAKQDTLLGKPKRLFAYAVSRNWSELTYKWENYVTLLQIPKQNCMQNSKWFGQSSLLMKIPKLPFFPPSPTNRRSWAFVMINRANPLLQ